MMSTPFYAVFDLNFSNVYFVIGIFNNRSQKCDFLQVVKFPYPKNRFLVTLRSFFSMYELFPEQEWFFPVSTFNVEYFNEKMGSLAALEEVIHFPAKVLTLANFGYLGPPWKSIFSTYRQSFKKSSKIYLGKVAENIVLNFELSIFSGLRGGALAVLQVDIFQNPWF